MINPGLNAPLSDFLAERYEILGTIGSGSAATVHLAKRRSDGLRVAIKWLRRENTIRPEQTERFRREATVLKQITSPNVVRLLEYHEDRADFFIVMDYIDGVALDVLRRAAPWVPPEIVLLILQKVAAGLAEAHAAGILHRDLRPANLMLSHSGQVLLLDFGTALIPGIPRLTARGTSVENGAYRAPEIGKGRDADVLTDIYSLGVSVCQLLTQNLPAFRDGARVLSVEGLDLPLTPAGYGPSVSRQSIGELGNRMIAEDRSRRISSVAELQDAIDNCLTDIDRSGSLTRHGDSYLTLFAALSFDGSANNRAQLRRLKLDSAAQLFRKVDAENIAELSALLKQAYLIDKEDATVRAQLQEFEKFCESRPDLLLPVGGPSLGGKKANGPLIVAVPGPPTTPGRLHATPLPRGRVFLSWPPAVMNIDHIVVQQRQHPYAGFSDIAQLRGESSSYEVRGLTRNNQYDFRIRYVTEGGASGWSNQATVTIGGVPLGLIVGVVLGLVVLLAVVALALLSRKGGAGP